VTDLQLSSKLDARRVSLVATVYSCLIKTKYRRHSVRKIFAATVILTLIHSIVGVFNRFLHIAYLNVMK